MGKASISIAVSGSYNGSAIERAQKSLDRMAKSAAASSETVAKSMMESGAKAAELGGRLYTLGDSVDQAGQRMTKGLTVPLAAAGAGALVAAAEFDSAGSKIDAACGGAAKGAEALKNVGRNLYKDGWGESMDSLSDSLVRAREILGDLSETDMSYAVEGAMTLEKAYGSDFAETLRGVSVLMAKFGLSATEATDLMVSGTQRGLDYTKELGDNLSEYSGRWADAGMSASQYFSLLEAGAQNGAYQLDKVGDFLNEFLTSLTDGRMEEGIGSFSQGTQDAFNSFKEGGASAEDVLDSVIGELASMPDEYKRAQVASELWSSLGEDNAMSMITALSGVQDTFTDVSGSAQEAGDKINDNLQNKATSAIRTAQEALEPFASVAVDMLGTAADTAKQASGEFAELDDGTKQLAVGAGILAAAAGPVVSVGGKLAKGAGSLIASYGRLKQDVATYADAMKTTNVAALEAYGAQDKYNKALSKNPAVKAAGGVKQYVDAVTSANRATADYDSAVSRLNREQSKGIKANAERVSALEAEVAQTKNAMAAAKGTVDGYKASATAASASTAAVKAQSVAMKAAAVAGTALKTALATCVPIAIVTALASLVSQFAAAREHADLLADATTGLETAIGAAGAAYGEATQSISAAADGFAGVARTSQEALESQKELAQSCRDTWSDYGTNAALVDGYASTIENLSGKVDELGNQQSLTEEEQTRLKVAVDGFNEICGTSISIIDPLTGALSEQKDAVYAVADAYKEQARTQAAQELLTEVQKEQIQTTADLAAAQEELNGMSEGYCMQLGNLKVFQDEANVNYEKQKQKVSDLQAASDSLNKTEQQYIDVLTEAADAQYATSAAISEFVNSKESMVAAADEAGASIDGLSDALSRCGVSTEDLGDLTDGELADLARSYDGSLSSVIEKCREYGIEIPESLAAGIEIGSGKPAESQRMMLDAMTLELTGGDVVKAAEVLGRDIDEGLKKAIIDGTDMPVGAMGAMSEDTIEAAKKAWESHSPSKVMYRLGTDIDEGLSDGIEDGSDGPHSAMLTLAGLMQQAVSGLPGFSRQTGYSSGSNMASSIGGWAGGVLNSATSLANSAVSGVSGTPGSFSSTGSSAASGFGSAIGSASAYSKGRQLAGTAEDGVRSVSGYSLGNDFASGYIRGIGANIGAAIGAGVNLALAAAQGVREGQRSASPSKVARSLGNDWGEGYKLGMADQYGGAEAGSAGLVAAAESGLESHPAKTALYMDAVSPARLANVGGGGAAATHEGVIERLDRIIALLESLDSGMTRKVAAAMPSSLTVNEVELFRLGKNVGL